MDRQGYHAVSACGCLSFRQSPFPGYIGNETNDGRVFMGEMIVRQPNGLLARFSTVTDSFTEMDLSPEGALEAITQDQIDHLLQSARRAVRAGIEDWIPHTVGRKGDGLARWRHCLALIEQVHGKAAAQEVCATGEKTARSLVKWAG